MCAKTRQKVFKFEINEIDDISTWRVKTVLMENNIDYSHQIIIRDVFQHILSKISSPPASTTKKKHQGLTSPTFRIQTNIIFVWTQIAYFIGKTGFRVRITPEF